MKIVFFLHASIAIGLVLCEVPGATQSLALHAAAGDAGLVFASTGTAADPFDGLLGLPVVLDLDRLVLTEPLAPQGYEAPALFNYVLPGPQAAGAALYAQAALIDPLGSVAVTNPLTVVLGL